MSTGAYLVGVCFFVPTLAACLGAAAVVVTRRYGYLSGLVRGLAFCVMATAAVLVAYVLPAVLGVLSRGTVLAAAFLCLAASWVLNRGVAPARPDADPPREIGSRMSVAVAVVGILVLMTYEATRARYLIGRPVTDIDMLGFHLPGVARFIQTQTLWHVDQFLPGFATAQYPHNGDFLILGVVLPWHEMAFARVPAILFFVVAGLAVYALAVELGARRAPAATFAALALAVPPLSNFALEGLPDDTAVALVAIGCLFLVRHCRTRRPGELVLAGLSLGLALGAEWFGLTATAVIVVVWIARRLPAPQTRRGWFRDALGLLAMILAGGGLWLLRNLIESGNPLYPKAISLAGVTVFSGSRGDVIDRFGYSIFDYLFKPHILRTYIYPGFKTQLGLAGLLLLVLVVFGLASWLRRGWRANGAALRAGAVAVLGLLVIYAVTPGTAYGLKNVPIEAHVTIRWLTPTVALAAAVAAASLRWLGKWTLLVELAALVALGWAVDHGPPVPRGPAVVIGLVLTALFAAALIAARGRRWRVSPLGGAGLAAAALIGLVILGRIDQHRVDSHGYASSDPVFAYIDRYAPSGHRIGLTGSTGATPGLAPTLPAFGPRLGNVVTYVGPRVVHSVEVPGREIQFLHELQSGRYDLLMIGLPYAGQTDVWARSLGFRQLVRSDRLALYAIPPGA